MDSLKLARKLNYIKYSWTSSRVRWVEWRTDHLPLLLAREYFTEYSVYVTKTN